MPSKLCPVLDNIGYLFIFFQSTRFINQLLIPVFATNTAGPNGDRYVRLAFIVYHEDDVHVIFGLGAFTDASQYISAINNEMYHQPTTAVQRLSL
jgi:hypothetical protein